MSPDGYDTEGQPQAAFQGDPLLAGLVREVNGGDADDGLSITLIVGGAIVSGKLGSRTAYYRACMWHLDQGAERDNVEIRAVFRSDAEAGELAPSSWPSYVHVKDVRFFDATGASVPRGRHWPSVWWRGRIERVDGWTLGELRGDQGEEE